MKPQVILLSMMLISLLTTKNHAQVIIHEGTGNPDSSAILDIQSTDKGLLIPRMTTLERSSILNPATGLMVFDTDDQSFYYFSGNIWISFSKIISIEDADGDTRITVEDLPDEDMIRMDVNGNEALQITSSGLIGVGISPPSERLHVIGNIKCSGSLSSGSTLTLDGNTHRITSSAHLDMHLSSGRAFRLEATASSPNIIAGFSGNSVTPPFPGCTIAGGGDTGNPNSVAFSFGTIGGGVGNEVTGHSSTVAGGRFNLAGQDQSTVAGGQNNTASRHGAIGGGSQNTANNMELGGATVAGGFSNQALGGASTIGGGDSNQASQHYATVPGGSSNHAGGQFSFAAGRRAKVRTPAQVGGGDPDGDQGSFVWADATNADFTSSGPNQFLIRAAGGLGLNRNNPVHPIHVGTSSSNGNGAHLTAGGMWTNVSDRNTKQNIEPANTEMVLNQLANLPIQYWQYMGEEQGIRHLGPMAQDFYDHFGLGHSDTHIGTADVDGVALAAIQALYQIVREQKTQIDSLQQRLESYIQNTQE